ncbi:MAG: glycosyltransferase [Mesorhizobium sp.]|nr:MAG: glycosyltransferase [Mesorhizobium sp.]RWC63892.1 MAG: glycosyltransferase [Mesorhizobium sp.]
MLPKPTPMSFGANRDSWRPMKSKLALIAIPLDIRGGAETILNLVARALASRPDWDVEIGFLGGQIAGEVAGSHQYGIRRSYGIGGGKAMSEVLLASRLIRHRYDLVFSSHARVNSFLAAARSVGVLRSRRLVTRESTVLLDRFKGPRALAYRALYAAYGSQDMVVAQTSYMNERLHHVLPRRAIAKLCTLPNPVDEDLIVKMSSETLPDDDAKMFSHRPQIVWCGRLIEVKRPTIAIDVLAEVRRRTGEDYELTIVGSGPLEAELRARAGNLDLASRVNLLGQRDNPFPLFRASRAGMLTSATEGFPNVLLEMMACRIPGIVTTPCAGDLDKLSGLEISAGFGASEIADALMKVIRGSNRSALYGKTLSERSPGRFADMLLGAPWSYPGGQR